MTLHTSDGAVVNIIGRPILCRFGPEDDLSGSYSMPIQTQQGWCFRLSYIYSLYNSWFGRVTGGVVDKTNKTLESRMPFGLPPYFMAKSQLRKWCYYVHFHLSYCLFAFPQMFLTTSTCLIGVQTSRRISLGPWGKALLEKTRLKPYPQNCPGGLRRRLVLKTVRPSSTPLDVPSRESSCRLLTALSLDY